MGFRNLTGRALHTQLELFLKQLDLRLLQLLDTLIFQLARFHGLHHRPSHDTGAYRQLGRGQTERFTRNVF